MMLTRMPSLRSPTRSELRRTSGALTAALRALAAKCAADNVSAAAAAIAFFSLLTAFPGFGVILCCYGLVANPMMVERHLGFISGLLPDTVVQLLSADLHGFLRFQHRHPGVAVTLSLFFTVGSGRAAVGALIGALNTVYGRKDGRKAWHRHGLGLALIAAILSFVAITFALVALTPLFVYTFVPLGHGWRHAIDYVRWPVLAVLTMAALTRLYRLAPHHAAGRGRGWFGWGALVGTILWLIFSVAYSYYLGEVGGYTVIYGSVSATVALLIWLYLSSLAVLIGAEIDAMKREGMTWPTDMSTPPTPSG
jgi:membrane protein